MKNLKYLLIHFFTFSCICITAQVGIETNVISSVSSLLEFKAGTTKGIILPQVKNTSDMRNVLGGTIIFDGETAKVKYYNGTTWIDLTTDTGKSNVLIEGLEQDNNQGAIIGANSSTANGVLVLESADKALILPNVIDPVKNVLLPWAGMLCYDPVAKIVCMYNGKAWFFWGRTTEV